MAARLEARAAEIAKQRLVELPPPVAVPEFVGGFPREAVALLTESYREMLSVQGLYNQNAVRQRQVARILESRHGAEIASRAISDTAFAKEAFGDFQAESRFYSIDVLRTAAKKGDERWLLRSADALARELTLTGGGGAALDEGRSTDLRDLMHAYIDVKGVQSLANGESALLRSLGYSPGMPAPVKRIYDDVLFLRLKALHGREQAASMTAALLEG
ncbi:hypothetical protein A176_004037 [Myxococcus hansupus]|uniref:Uncharacterized protein n=1 Tax=Pseudomyxococcus hansupus TaxID=1297742 RepID=A0A0H4X0L3_9BACT|nr:hypothetical protein A176_004037 [Myxococcus hansupus]